jgi:hypothetical protein
MKTKLERKNGYLLLFKSKADSLTPKLSDMRGAVRQVEGSKPLRVLVTSFYKLLQKGGFSPRLRHVQISIRYCLWS